MNTIVLRWHFHDVELLPPPPPPQDNGGAFLHKLMLPPPPRIPLFPPTAFADEVADTHFYPPPALQLLMREVYHGALSHPLIPYPPDLSHITPQVLHQFIQDHYTGPHMVLSGAGVNHQQLVDLAAPMLENVPSGEGAKAANQQQQQGEGVIPPPPGSRGVLRPYQDPPSDYVGGLVHMPGSFPQANMILAFEYAGGWRDIQVRDLEGFEGQAVRV